MRVVIKDDTLRRNAVLMITPAMREEAAKAGRPIPASTKFVLGKDRQGRQVQETVVVDRVLEGAHLLHAVKRAKRFIRSKGYRQRGHTPPRHIALFMAAFHKADPEAFKRAMA